MNTHHTSCPVTHGWHGNCDCEPLEPWERALIEDTDDLTMDRPSMFTEEHDCTLTVVFHNRETVTVGGIHDESMKMEGDTLVAEDTNVHSTTIYYFPHVAYWHTKV